MVAQAPFLASSFLTWSLLTPLVTETPIPHLPRMARTVKLLDLLTNRYHVGLLRGEDEERLALDLPRTAAFHAGQRVRFIVADEQPLVSRQAMHTAVITQASPHGTGMRLELSLLTEAAAA